MSKRLSKYISSFDCFDKSLIVLSATSGSISIESFSAVIGTPLGIASASLQSYIFIFYRTCKRVLKATRNKKKKHNKIIILARSKLKSIESRMSEALMNN